VINLNLTSTDTFIYSQFWVKQIVKKGQKTEQKMLDGDLLEYFLWGSGAVKKTRFFK